MPRTETIALTGTVEHVFAHRFTILADGRVHLADLSPGGLRDFPLRAGLPVTLTGEQRPSEIKVSRIATPGGEPVAIVHGKPHHPSGHRHADAPANPSVVLRTVADAGWSAAGEPRRKPKHFEVLARRGDGPLTELHVDLAGVLYRQKPADAAKWGL